MHAVVITSLSLFIVLFIVKTSSIVSLRELLSDKVEARFLVSCSPPTFPILLLKPAPRFRKEGVPVDPASRFLEVVSFALGAEGGFFGLPGSFRPPMVVVGLTMIAVKKFTVFQSVNFQLWIYEPKVRQWTTFFLNLYHVK